jgi:hypothetical protein
VTFPSRRKQVRAVGEGNDPSATRARSEDPALGNIANSTKNVRCPRLWRRAGSRHERRAHRNKRGAVLPRPRKRLATYLCSSRPSVLKAGARTLALILNLSEEFEEPAL